MKSIGIRELRQNASQYIRLVKAGETVEVTDRGEPVAQLVPIPRHESILDRMVREGRATRAEGDLLDIEPIEPVPGETPLSELIIAAREEERW
jgi:prevent-host-death family protein